MLFFKCSFFESVSKYVLYILIIHIPESSQIYRLSLITSCLANILFKIKHPLSFVQFPIVCISLNATFLSLTLFICLSMFSIFFPSRASWHLKHSYFTSSVSSKIIVIFESVNSNICVTFESSSDICIVCSNHVFPRLLVL